MKITKFEVEGFRGFKDKLSWNLHPKVNVLVGVNGSGKSSLLDGIDFMFNSFKKEFHSELPISDDSRLLTVNKRSKALKNKIQFDFQEDKIGWEVFKRREKHTLTRPIGETKKVLNLFFEKYAVRNTEKDVKLNLPILQYYRPLRSFKEIKNPFYGKGNLSYQLYDETFLQERNLFENFKLWYINAKNFENHIRLERDSRFYFNALRIVEVALQDFLKEVSGQSNNTMKLILTYEDTMESSVTSGHMPNPQVAFMKDDETFFIEDLSDGEQSLLMLITTITRDLFNVKIHLYGAGRTANLSVESILQSPGIVLIDEIELHLHPAWQRNIIPALTKTFPNIQFIVTTHSPQVLSNVADESVFIIEDNQIISNTAHTMGRDSNSILYDIFGVNKHPEISQRILDKFYRYLETDLSKAEELLQQLTDLLGEEDHEVKRAKDFLDLEKRYPQQSND